MQPVKKLLLVIFIGLSFFTSLGQSKPSGFPITKSTGWIEYGYLQNDSGRIDAYRDTNWTPRFIPTTVWWLNTGVDSAFWTYKKTTGQRWFKEGGGSGGGSTDTALIKTIVSDSLEGYVTISTPQTITGKKSFTDTVFVNGFIGASVGNDFKIITANTQFVRISNGNRSIAIGEATVANGYAALAAGTGSSASATGSLALGNSATASGGDAIALGSHATASGTISSALGSYTNAPSFGEAVLGYNNTPYTPASTTDTVGTDRLFTIGNGGSGANPSDALVMLKNAKTKVYGVWQYAGNYAANFNDSSLVNKKYVDSLVATVSSGLLSTNFVYNEEFTGSTSSTYTLANTPITGKLVVFKNGVKLPNSEFSLSGAIVTLTSARVSGDILSNDYIK